MSGTYIAVNLDDATLDSIQDIQRSLNLYNPVPRDKLHSTICYSRVEVPYFCDENPQQIGTSAGLEVFDNGKKRTLVLKLDSPYLVDKHNITRELGATYDYPDYTPHITLSYDIGYIDYSSFDIPPINIGSSGEYQEALDLDWTA